MYKFKKIAFQIGFYVWSFTWGAIQSILGAAVALIAFQFAPGARMKRDGLFFCVEIPGITWGLECGIFYICSVDALQFIRLHEKGHQIQNLIFGPLQPFIITIPSILRFWYRRFRAAIKHPCKTDYYDIWFESGATELGVNFEKFLKNIGFKI